MGTFLEQLGIEFAGGLLTVLVAYVFLDHWAKKREAKAAGQANDRLVTAVLLNQFPPLLSRLTDVARDAFRHSEPRGQPQTYTSGRSAELASELRHLVNVLGDVAETLSALYKERADEKEEKGDLPLLDLYFRFNNALVVAALKMNRTGPSEEYDREELARCGVTGGFLLSVIEGGYPELKLGRSHMDRILVEFGGFTEDVQKAKGKDLGWEVEWFQSFAAIMGHSATLMGDVIVEEFGAEVRSLDQEPEARSSLIGHLQAFLRTLPTLGAHAPPQEGTDGWAAEEDTRLEG